LQRRKPLREGEKEGKDTKREEGGTHTQREGETLVER